MLMRLALKIVMTFGVTLTPVTRGHFGTFKISWVTPFAWNLMFRFVRTNETGGLMMKVVFVCEGPWR